MQEVLGVKLISQAQEGHAEPSFAPDTSCSSSVLCSGLPRHSHPCPSGKALQGGASGSGKSPRMLG